MDLRYLARNQIIGNVPTAPLSTLADLLDLESHGTGKRDASLSVVCTSVFIP